MRIYIFRKGKCVLNHRRFKSEIVFKFKLHYHKPQEFIYINQAYSHLHLITIDKLKCKTVNKWQVGKDSPAGASWFCKSEHHHDCHVLGIRKGDRVNGSNCH